MGRTESPSLTTSVDRPNARKSKAPDYRIITHGAISRYPPTVSLPGNAGGVPRTANAWRRPVIHQDASRRKTSPGARPPHYASSARRNSASKRAARRADLSTGASQLSSIHSTKTRLANTTGRNSHRQGPDYESFSETGRYIMNGARYDRFKQYGH